MCLLAVTVLCCSGNGDSDSSVQPTHIAEERTTKPCDKAAALGRIKDFRVTGASFGGPYRGVGHNAITTAIVDCGSGIVPDLIAYLAHSNYNESICIVFCLSELKATDAKRAVDRLDKQLQGGTRFTEPHDATLEVQIMHYYKVIK
jgi:hypothetical protein